MGAPGTVRVAVAEQASRLRTGGAVGNPVQVAGEAVVGSARRKRREREQDLAAVELATRAAATATAVASGALTGVIVPSTARR